MTPKDKAKELVDKFIDYAYHWDEGFPLPKEYTPIWNAKQCALVCIDEILKNDDRMYLGSNDINYWEQVKQEINKL